MTGVDGVVLEEEGALRGGGLVDSEWDKGMGSKVFIWDEVEEGCYVVIQLRGELFEFILFGS